ncbi:MAG: endonuclease III [Desulfarculus sp.]|nr:endonuclease III [Desulfarculus sp.]
MSARAARPDAPPAPSRVRAVLAVLDQLYPQARCTLDHQDPWQLLVATILSAQCTDQRVNQVTPGLFARFADPAAMATAEPAELEELIRSTGFFHNKAKSILGAARALVERHGGVVPGSLEELVKLPGVGRKTANVVLGDAFGIPGITVDTHVGRVAKRLGFTSQDDPVKVEFELMACVPLARWTLFSHQVILHGRQVCQARKPRCQQCLLLPHCPYGQEHAPV